MPAILGQIQELMTGLDSADAQSRPNLIVLSSGVWVLIYSEHDGVGVDEWHLWGRISYTEGGTWEPATQLTGIAGDTNNYGIVGEHDFNAQLVELTEGKIGIVFERYPARWNYTTPPSYHEFFAMVLEIDSVNSILKYSTGKKPTALGLTSGITRTVFIPSIEKLLNGKVLVVCTGTTPGQLMTYTRPNANWADFLSGWVPSSVGNFGQKITALHGSGVPIIEPKLLSIKYTGHLLCFYSYATEADKYNICYQLAYRVSTDYGATWGDKINVTDYEGLPPNIGNVAVAPFAIENDKKEIILGYSEMFAPIVAGIGTTNFSIPPDFSDGVFTGIEYHKDSRRIIISCRGTVGAATGGLLIVDLQSLVITRLRNDTSPALPDRKISAIKLDGNTLWCSTDTGVFRILDISLPISAWLFDYQNMGKIISCIDVDTDRVYYGIRSPVPSWGSMVGSQKKSDFINGTPTVNPRMHGVTGFGYSYCEGILVTDNDIIATHCYSVVKLNKDGSPGVTIYSELQIAGCSITWDVYNEVILVSDSGSVRVFNYIPIFDMATAGLNPIGYSMSYSRTIGYDSTPALLKCANSMISFATAGDKKDISILSFSGDGEDTQPNITFLDVGNDKAYNICMQPYLYGRSLIGTGSTQQVYYSYQGEILIAANDSLITYWNFGKRARYRQKIGNYNDATGIIVFGENSIESIEPSLEAKGHTLDACLAVNSSSRVVSIFTVETPSTSRNLYYGTGEPIESQDDFKLKPGRGGRDVTLTQLSPSGSDNNSVMLKIGVESGVKRRAAMWFPLNKIPGIADVTSVSVGFYAYDMSGEASISATIHKITKDWTEGANWNTYDGVHNWDTLGGDYDLTPIATAVLSGTGWLEFSSSELQDLIEGFLSGLKDNYGFLIKVSDEDSEGLKSVYSMGEYGQSGAIDNYYHPYIKIEYTEDYSFINSVMADNPLAIEMKAEKYDIVKDVGPYNTEVEGPPFSIKSGLPYFSQPKDVSDLIKSYSIDQKRRQLADNWSAEVFDDELGTYQEYWSPMSVLRISERIMSPTLESKWFTRFTGIVSSDPESIKGDIPSLQISGLSTAKLGLIDPVEAIYEAGIIGHFEAPLEKTEHSGFYIYRHKLSTGESTYNWNPNIPPDLYTYKTKNKKVPLKIKSGLVDIRYGDGEVWIQKDYHDSSIAAEGLGLNNSKFKLFITYSRWKTPLDSFVDSNSLNTVIFDLLKRSGFQRIDNTGLAYIWSLPPVLDNFVFDRVYLCRNGVWIDKSNDVQKESGSIPFSSLTLGEYAEDCIYFKLNTINGKYNWIQSVLKQGAVGGKFTFEIFNGVVWSEITPLAKNWLRGGTDDGAGDLTESGLINFHEGELSGWTECNLGKMHPSENLDTDNGFWMRVRCVTVPTTPVQIHRWAGKQIIVIPSDGKSNVISIWDDKKPMDAIDGYLKDYGIPNYEVTIDPNGDIRGKYFVQKSVADYSLDTVSNMSRQRDDSNIYTKVSLKIKDSDKSLIDYCKFIAGATIYPISYNIVDNVGASYDLSLYWSNLSAITDSMKDSGSDLIWASGIGGVPIGRHLDVKYSEKLPLFIVDFGSLIRVHRLTFLAGSGSGSDLSIGIDFSTDGINWGGLDNNLSSIVGPSVKAWKFAGDTKIPSVGSLSGFSRLTSVIGASPDPIVIDFTKDRDPDLPEVKYMRFIAIRPGSKTLTGTSLVDRIYLHIGDIKVEGVSISEPRYAVAELGVTPPFDTDADKAFVRKYWKRTYVIGERDVYASTMLEGTRKALNVLRELYRLYDPLSIEGIHPAVQLGQTIQVTNSILGVNANYLVEEISHTQGFGITCKIVPYK